MGFDLPEPRRRLSLKQARREDLLPREGGRPILDQRPSRGHQILERLQDSDLVVCASSSRTAPIRASIVASTRSVLASRPVASANRRAGRGLTLAQARHCRHKRPGNWQTGRPGAGVFLIFVTDVHALRLETAIGI